MHRTLVCSVLFSFYFSLTRRCCFALFQLHVDTTSASNEWNFTLAHTHGSHRQWGRTSAMSGWLVFVQTLII